MAQEIKKVIVVGAGGNLGPFVVQELLAAKFQVSVLSRESSTSTFAPEVTVYKSDFSHASLVSAFQGQDAVVSTVASVAVPVQKGLVDAALEAGVKRFIPGEFGTNTTTDRTLEVVAPLRGKRVIADYLRSKQGQSNDFSWTAIITGAFFDWGLVRTPSPYLPFSIPTRTATLPTPPSLRNIKISVSTLPQIGRAVASALLPAHLAATKNQYLLVRSFSLSQLELLAALERVTGSKWTVEDDAPDSEKYAQAAEKLGKGDFSVFGQLLATAFYDPATGSYFDELKEYANPLLELPQEDLDEVVAAAVKEASGKSSL